MGKMMLLIALSWTASARDFAGTMTVYVYNVAGARAAVVAEGEREASFVFRWAGIAVRWADCPAVDLVRGDSQVCVEPNASCIFTVVIGEGFAEAALKDTALGFAMPFSGARNHAGVAYPRLKQVTDANRDLVDDGGLLGAIMAHELAHLLLSSVHHGPGIMQADWNRAEFKRIGNRCFLFTPKQAEALRAGLRSRNFVVVPNVSNLMTAVPHE